MCMKVGVHGSACRERGEGGGKSKGEKVEKRKKNETRNQKLNSSMGCLILLDLLMPAVGYHAMGNMVTDVCVSISR